LSLTSNRVERMWRLRSSVCGLLECVVYDSQEGYTVCITFGDELLCLNEVKTLEEARRTAVDWRRALLPVTESCE
jgi:hypothetical protein